MKKLLFALLIIGTSIANGQAVFEKSYNNMESFQGVVNIDGHGQFYCFLKSGEAELYTKSHVLYKTIQFKYAGSQVYGYLLSSSLVNSDNNIEVIYYCHENSSDWKTYIQGEAGNLIQTLNGTPWLYLSIEGDFKIVLSNTGVSGEVDIYDLPGTLPLAVDEPGTIELLKPYPNPSSGAIRLPYNLKPNQTGQLIITDLSGRIIRQYTVTGVYSDLILSPGELSPRQYIYTVTDGETRQSGKFIVN